MIIIVLCQNLTVQKAIKTKNDEDSLVVKKKLTNLTDLDEFKEKMTSKYKNRKNIKTLIIGYICLFGCPRQGSSAFPMNILMSPGHR